MRKNQRGFLGAPSRALVLCAHTDDEFGCAGTMVRLLEVGAEVRYLALSRCEQSIPQGLAEDTLERECCECTSQLGLDPAAVEVDRFPVRSFPAHRQLILERLYSVSRDYRPDLVLLPSSFDIHQDHHTVYEEGLRAFKHSTLLGYELPQNLVTFNNSAFVALSEDDVNLKVAALAMYRSQRFRNYSREDFIRSLARVRGVQCDAEYAEAFELVRLVIR
jgi:LmbE family N-acetylglucosaminyl deacetylase